MPEGSCKWRWSFWHHLMKNASRTLKWCNYRVLFNFWFQQLQSVILPCRVYTNSLIYFQEFSSYCILQVWLLLLASVEKWKSAHNVMHSRFVAQSLYGNYTFKLVCSLNSQLDLPTWSSTGPSGLIFKLQCVLQLQPTAPPWGTHHIAMFMTQYGAAGHSCNTGCNKTNAV